MSLAMMGSFGIEYFIIIVLCVIIAGAVGLLAGKVIKNGFTPLKNILLGIVGCTIGGVLAFNIYKGIIQASTTGINMTSNELLTRVILCTLLGAIIVGILLVYIVSKIKDKSEK